MRSASLLLSAPLIVSLSACALEDKDCSLDSTEPIGEAEVVDRVEDAPAFFEWFVGTHPVIVYADDTPGRYANTAPVDGVQAVLTVTRVGEGGELHFGSCADEVQVGFDVSITIESSEGSIPVVPEYRIWAVPSREQACDVEPDPPTAAEIELLGSLVYPASFPGGEYQPHVSLTVPARLAGGESRCLGGIEALDRAGRAKPFLEFRCL